MKKANEEEIKQYFKNMVEIQNVLLSYLENDDVINDDILYDNLTSSIKLCI